MDPSRAVSAYRAVWRATGIVFRGDISTLSSARTKIRQGFAEDRQATLSADQFEEKVTYANQIALFLRQNIVQGAKQEQSDRYRLNITKDTELGDNDDIKKGSRLPQSDFGECCGGSSEPSKPVAA